MAFRFFIELSYDGTAYHGWQVQPNAKTIQEELNGALSTILREDIYAVGCGRTDSGVHARQFFAHFDTTVPIADPEKVCFHLNCILNQAIAVGRIFPVEPEMHARFSATSRTYEYLITSRKDPFAQHRAWEVREAFDIERLNRAAAVLSEYQDFSSFAKSHNDSETNLCDIYSATWSAVPGGYRFEITANRFLRNMVRAIVGTMMEIQHGRMSLDQLRQVIEERNRSSAGLSVPAHGLYLVAITYPEGVLPS